MSDAAVKDWWGETTYAYELREQMLGCVISVTETDFVFRPICRRHVDNEFRIEKFVEEDVSHDRTFDIKSLFTEKNRPRVIVGTRLMYTQECMDLLNYECVDDKMEPTRARRTSTFFRFLSP